MEQLSFDDALAGDEAEHWLPVLGWEGLYEVSDLGRVRSLPRLGANGRVYGGRMLTAALPNGYPRVALSRPAGHRLAFVHILVLEAFVGPRPPGMQACHENGVRTDAHVANLRWDTPKGNERDKHRHGTAMWGTRHHCAKVSDDAVAEIRRCKLAGATGSEPPITNADLAAMFGVSTTTIVAIVTGKRWVRRQDGSPLPNPSAVLSAGRLERAGQLSYGEGHCFAKLTEHDVRKIRALRAAEGATLARLGAEFGVSKQSIAAILSGRNWKHVA